MSVETPIAPVRRPHADAFAPAVAVCCVALASAGLPGCAGEDEPPSPPRPKVFAATPVVREVVDWDEYTARLRAVDTVEIRPRVGGELTELGFTDGQMVAKGDLLFRIDPRPFEAAVARAEGDLAAARAARAEAEAARTQALAADVQAEAALELRDIQLARSRQLVRRGARTQEELDIEESQRKQSAADVAAARARIKSAAAAIQTAEARVAAEEAAVAAAELDLSFTEVCSPIAGRASRHLVDVGNLVVGENGGGATLLTTVVSRDPIHAFVSAPERQFLKYVRQAASGDRPSSRDVRNPAMLKLADEDDYAHTGAIDFVDNQLDAGTDTMTGRLEFPNPDGVLTPGLFAKVRILGSGLYEALLIPDAGRFDGAEPDVRARRGAGLRGRPAARRRRRSARTAGETGRHHRRPPAGDARPAGGRAAGRAGRVGADRPRRHPRPAVRPARVPGGGGAGRNRTRRGRFRAGHPPGPPPRHARRSRSDFLLT